MEKFETFNINVEKKYIKIKMIGMGAVALSALEELSLFDDMQSYAVIRDVDKVRLEHFIDNSDIIFLVADLDDHSVVQDISKITDILSTCKKRFVTILANVKEEQIMMSKIVKDIRQKSSLLIVEHQEDIEISTAATIRQKFKKIINALYALIDVEINEVRVHSTMLSSLISLNSFFDERCELFIYSDSLEKLRLSIKNEERFNQIIENAKQAWIAHPFIDDDTESIVKIYGFIGSIEESIDEDAPCFLSPRSDMKEDSAIVLLAL